MDRLLIVFSLAAMVVLGCQPYNVEDLAGNWKATVVIDDGDTAKADLTMVKLNLEDDQKFSYQMTTNDQLSGNYDIKKELLHLYATVPEKDTIIVQVLSLEENSLILRMNHEGLERQMLLSRQ